MDGTLPNFKVGEPVSNIFENRNLTIDDDTESSFVILARNVVGPSTKLISNDTESPKINFDDEQTISKNTQNISEEYAKHKNILEENSSIMNEQYEKKEVTYMCQEDRQKYMKQLLDMMKVGNEHLRILVQNGSESLLTSRLPIIETDCIGKKIVTEIEKPKEIDDVTNQVKNISLDDIENKLCRMQEVYQNLRKNCDKSAVQIKDFESFVTNLPKMSTEIEEPINGTKVLKYFNNFSNDNVQDQSEKVIDRLPAAISNEIEDFGIKAVTERESSFDDNMAVISLNNSNKDSSKMNDIPLADTQEPVTEAFVRSSVIKKIPMKELSQPNKITANRKSYHEEDKKSMTSFSSINSSVREVQEEYADVGKEVNQWNEKATLIQQQINLNEEKAPVIERKGLQDFREDYDRQQQLHEILVIKEKCEELTKRMEDIETESKNIHEAKKDMLQERQNLEELQKLIDDEVKSHHEQQSAVMEENVLLRARYDALEMDFKNLNTDLIDSHKMITKLRSENTALKELADVAEVYKVQNDVQAKDILQMFEAQQNYLEEIERLSNENDKLKDKLKKANERLQNQSDSDE